MTEKRYIAFKGAVIELTRNSEGFWVDDFPTIYAFREKETSVDDKDVCGIGSFTLDKDDPRNAACKPHDYAYESPAYQAFHSRAEADFYLKQLLEQIPGYEGALTPELFYRITRLLGGGFWENKETNN